MNSNSFAGMHSFSKMGILLVTGSLLNHNKNNEDGCFDAQTGTGAVIALRDIAKGEELTIWYTNDLAALAKYGTYAKFALRTSDYLGPSCTHAVRTPSYGCCKFG